MTMKVLRRYVVVTRYDSCLKFNEIIRVFPFSIYCISIYYDRLNKAFVNAKLLFKRGTKQHVLIIYRNK